VGGEKARQAKGNEGGTQGFWYYDFDDFDYFRPKPLRRDCPSADWPTAHPRPPRSDYIKNQVKFLGSGLIKSSI